MPIAIVFFILVISAVGYGIVNWGQKEEIVFIERIASFDGKDVAIVPGTSGGEGSISTKAVERLQAALQLYEAGLVKLIIVSGDEKEVKAMTQYLMRKGVPSECLASDANGIDTYETIARAKEKFGEKSYYFCTQELYSNRARFLMDCLDMDGTVVCVDTMYYSGVIRNSVREYFAATKAVIESVILSGKSKISIEDEDFIVVDAPVDNPHFVYAEELETPKDIKVTDINPDDDYDVLKAVEYARTYALESNPMYARFEQNCTNFTSQCLVAGGIPMQGEEKISEKKRWNISGNKTEWFSISEMENTDGLRHYSTSNTFINTDAFVRYFTEERGYEFTIYDNTYEGNLQCYKELAAGDVLVLYNEDGTVAHLGIISGIGDMNAYYCANTMERRDFGVFTINEETYSKIGIIHMSWK